MRLVGIVRSRYILESVIYVDVENMKEVDVYHVIMISLCIQVYIDDYTYVYVYKR